MKKTIKNSIVLAACLLMAFMVKATIIGGPDGNAANEQNSVLGCDDDNNQQAKGVRVTCTKDGKRGTQCVTSGRGPVCDLKVIDCVIQPQ